MMHRCSSSCHGSMVGPCSCGLFHSQSGTNTTTTSAFSMLFSHNTTFDHEYSENMYSFAPSSSSSVDCTLSLGTPSTRLTNDNEKRGHYSNERRSSSNCMSNFWDILHPKQHTTPSAHKSTRGGNNGNTNSSDPLVARRCANCDTTSTPLWRNGPRGPKSLCNACGIRFKKEERRASAAAATANGGGMETHQHVINTTTTSWVHHQPQKMPCYSSAAYGNEFRFIEDDDHRDSDATGIPFLPWRLNVADRPSLVHDFTR
ncbi:GATA transcription factor 19 [Lycium barbarum]|uniref:GATA transcription factor 19-like n=1 Tax=Lycium ferocissimum TaxID=112874 RepID=UPI002814CF4A|nr:GATA transcription factor 19-like [Lycium ferocissimum]XP_059295142.1 GATA transcription factor 19-like [Lycium ferocissimum]XP_060192904.1 GATA transcription factor 19 [Lycium barbarum]